MELVTMQNIVLTILMGVMPLLSLCFALSLAFNLNRVDSRTSLICVVMGVLLVTPALTILISLI
tara:strand:+ start:200 stop:391 length:192 start_codon:yes stop_codon:yes gene_type:complete